MGARTNAAHDERLDEGMRLQRALVAAAEAEGAAQAGWKAGFGAPAARERFGLEAPLVGALLDRTRLELGAVARIGGWKDPRAEAELALLLGEDVDAGTTPEEAMASVAALAPAIELVDLDPPPQSPLDALSGNIFHRHWMTGEFVPLPAGADLSGLTADVSAMGSDIGTVHDLEALTGNAAEVLVEVARIGARHGRRLLRGDVVILGSVLPPTSITSGGAFRFALSSSGPIEVRFSD